MIFFMATSQQASLRKQTINRSKIVCIRIFSTRFSLFLVHGNLGKFAGFLHKKLRSAGKVERGDYLLPIQLLGFHR